MTTFPKLSYVCPIPWTQMRGDEKERFCSKCTRTVVNVSLLTEEQRAALLSRVSSEQICVAYYRRLSGEMVTPENPLKASEARHLVQYGVTALSLGAMAAAATFVAAPNDNLKNAGKQIVTAYTIAKVEVETRTREIVEKISAPFLPKKAPPVTMALGMIACPAPPPAPAGSPLPSPVPPSAPPAAWE